MNTIITISTQTQGSTFYNNIKDTRFNENVIMLITRGMY